MEAAAAQGAEAEREDGLKIARAYSTWRVSSHFPFLSRASLRAPCRPLLHMMSVKLTSLPWLDLGKKFAGKKSSGKKVAGDKS